MKILGIIPARYASTRFPGKPLADIAGKSMIQRVYEQASQSHSLDKVVVATEDQRIVDHVVAFGGNACITSAHHPSGTDRCFEALMLQKEKFDYVINIQGDEPFIGPEQIDLIASQLDGKTELSTLIKLIEDEDQLVSIGEVKVTFNKDRKALYFSRTIIPYLHNIPQKDWLTFFPFYKHVGMYAYRSDILEAITQLPISSLEKAESLEQLRWLENGYSIQLAITTVESMCVDTQDDLEKAVKFLEK